MEAEKWVQVLSTLGYPIYLFAGDCDEKEMSYAFLVPEAHFKHPEILEIYGAAFANARRPPEVTQKAEALKTHLKRRLYEFVSRFGIRLLIVENALTIPLNIPLGLALTEFIAETGMPVVAHHHDFYWERKRFLHNCVWDYLSMAFPPQLPSIRHVVINTAAAQQLSLRTGVSSMIIPNVMDFDHPPPNPGKYIDTMRSDFGIFRMLRRRLQTLLSMCFGEDQDLDE